MLTALATLVAVGILFALDPGGVIAESGFPEFGEMDWTQRAFWGFRTIGVAVAQLIVIVLWLWPKYRPPDAGSSYLGTPQPGSMPAAAVSVLQGHMIGSQTILASIIEMAQRSTIRIDVVSTRVGFLYRLSRWGTPQFEWEQTIISNLPSRPTTIDALREAIDRREDDIGDRIGDYLQNRGLFDDNPVRVRKENSDDGSTWWMLASLLTGLGSGFWAALWLDQWWANVLIGLFVGLVYSFLALPSGIRSGMVKPTSAGVAEIGRWIAWKDNLAATGSAISRDQSDPMFAHAVAFNAAQAWLNVSASAPPWFGSGGASTLSSDDLDAAWRAFLHAPEWWLEGRSDDAAKAAAQYGYELELEALGPLPLDFEEPAERATQSEFEDIVREMERRESPPADRPEAPSTEYRVYSSEGMAEGVAEEKKGRGCLPGCLLWLVGLLILGVLALGVLFSLDVLSPREKPCPLNSPPILTPAQIASLSDLVRDQCVQVRGTIVLKDAGELVIEMDRGEFVQRVTVLDPLDDLAAIPQGRVITLAGWLRVEDDDSYAVHFIPDRGPDREWWRNLLDNLEAFF